MPLLPLVEAPVEMILLVWRTYQAYGKRYR